MKILIENDIFDVVSRLKMIDSDYFVLYDTVTFCYQLHCKNQAHTSFCLSFGKSLDERAVDKTLLTRKQNKDKLFEELERGEKWK